MNGQTIFGYGSSLVADDRPLLDLTDDQLALLALGGIKILAREASEADDAQRMEQSLNGLVAAEIITRGLNPVEHFRALARRAGEALKAYLSARVPHDPRMN